MCAAKVEGGRGSTEGLERFWKPFCAVAGLPAWWDWEEWRDLGRKGGGLQSCRVVRAVSIHQFPSILSLANLG